MSAIPDKVMLEFLGHPNAFKAVLISSKASNFADQISWVREFCQDTMLKQLRAPYSSKPVAIIFNNEKDYVLYKLKWC